MKWKVETPSGKVYYYNPTEVQLAMIGCTLKNNVKTARKIFEGENKTVCAWILCEKIKLKMGDDRYKEEGIKFSYNPRKSPHWTLDGTPVDGIELDALHTIDYGVYLTTSELFLPNSFFETAEVSCSKS